LEASCKVNASATSASAASTRTLIDNWNKSSRQGVHRQGFRQGHQRPELERLLAFVREGDTVVVHSMDRLARNLDDLRRIVQGLTQRGVRMEFVKEGLTFTGEDSPMANLMLSVMGAFAEFERALIRERQREGIVLAKQRGAYRGRKKSLNSEQIAELKRRVAAGDQKTLVARDFGISRETLYQYLRED
jgi:DNA invertase Pin-like site-specific DNA recombinase